MKIRKETSQKREVSFCIDSKLNNVIIPHVNKCKHRFGIVSNPVIMPNRID